MLKKLNGWLLKKEAEFINEMLVSNNVSEKEEKPVTKTVKKAAAKKKAPAKKAPAAKKPAPAKKTTAPKKTTKKK